MIDGRKKGIVFEQKFVAFLKAYGISAVTSRSENRTLDNKGVDIVDNTKFYFQCKAVEQSMNNHKLLARMPRDKIGVIVHRRNRLGTTITMNLEEFANLLLYKYDERQLVESMLCGYMDSASIGNLHIQRMKHEES